jgi:hypothetical protein
LLRRIEWGWLGEGEGYFVIVLSSPFIFFIFCMARRNNLGERKAPACLVRPYSLKAAANPLDSHTLVLSSGRHFGGYRYPPAFIQRACCEIALITSIKEISITSFPSLMQTLQCNYLWSRSLFFDRLSTAAGEIIRWTAQGLIGSLVLKLFLCKAAAAPCS